MNSGQRPVASEKQGQQLIYYHMNIPIPSKTGQPMAAVRFSDMQGKSHWMAISPYFLRTSPKKASPAAACRRDAVVRVCLKKRGGGKSFWLSATVLRLFANIKIPSYRKKNSPAQAPCIPYLQYSTQKSGACAGERSRRGRLGGTGLSLRGGSLQGLSQRDPHLGRRTVKQLPWPGVEVTETLPPVRVTTRRTMASPTP